MIYLTEEKIRSYYGKPLAGDKSGRFNAEAGSRHSDEAFKYEFGYLGGRCVYAIIQKNRGASSINLLEAAALRSLSGKGKWSLMTALTMEKTPTELQKLLDKRSEELLYEYSHHADDRFKHPLFSAHQLNRRQVVVYHPKWRANLAMVAKDPL